MKGPSEGDLVEMDASDSDVGHEQQGRRPALVVSVDAFNEFGMAMVCPVTTHGGRATRARSTLEVPLPAGLRIRGEILTGQLRSVDWKARRATRLDTVPRATLLAVRARIKAILGT